MSVSRAAFVALSLPVLLAFAGCSSSGPSASSFVATADATSDFAATRSVRGADLSLALASMPEPGGSQVAMREKIFANGVKQDIVLAGDKSPFGDNLLVIAVQTAPPIAGARDQVPMYRPAESGIKQEILARYPQVDMQILTQPRRNAQGPFGLAIGRHSSGVRCVFAWQWIDDVRNPGGSSSSLGKLGSFGSTVQPALVRVNMCRKDATVDDLAMAVEGLTLAPSSVLDRALDSSRVTSSAVSVRATGGGGTSGGGMVMASNEGSLEGALTTSVRPQRARSEVAAAPSRQRVARRAPKKAEPTEETIAQQSPVAPVASAAPAYASGPRYLAPVPGAAAPNYGAPVASAAYAPPAYANAPTYTASTKSLDPSLPAAAYRGPGGATR